MRLIVLIFYLVLIILGVSFAALNASEATVNLYLTTFHLPVSLLITIVLGIGVLIGFLLFFGRYWRLKRNYKKLKHEMAMTEEEIKNLRSIPLKDQH